MCANVREEVSAQAGWATGPSSSWARIGEPDKPNLDAEVANTVPGELTVGRRFAVDVGIVWLAGGASPPAAYWRRDDALATAGDDSDVVAMAVRGDRPRCRCGEPAVMHDPDDPMSWIHAPDANDHGDHTAEV